MLRRYASLLICTLAGLLATGVAHADPTFTFLHSFQDPPNFESNFRSCITQFKATAGLPRDLLDQLNDAGIVVYYQPGAAGVEDPNPGGDSTGKLLYLYWDSNLGGSYPDNSPKVPCAALLGAVQHASRLFLGNACNGPLAANEAAYQYEAGISARSENWWLSGRRLKQRTTYQLSERTLELETWARWPGASVPPAPACNRSCLSSDALLASTDTALATGAAAACQRCTGFHQAGCVDFKGGIYSGGDHREVANGSLRINVGDYGYCQGRKPCQFKKCVTCPHLDTAFPKGGTVTAIATPGKGSKFARWGPGACKGQGPTCTFVARRASCITAQFLLTNPTAPPQSLPKVPCNP